MQGKFRIFEEEISFFETNFRGLFFLNEFFKVIKGEDHVEQPENDNN